MLALGSLKFEPDGELMDEIKQDVANEKMWKEALEAAEQGKKVSTFPCFLTTYYLKISNF